MKNRQAFELFAHTKKCIKNRIDTAPLLAMISTARQEMDGARNRFEEAVDPTLIDCYIYELNAAQLKFQFLLRRFKAVERLQ